MYNLQNITNTIASRVKGIYPLLGKEQAKIYDTMFKIVPHSIGQMYFQEIENNPLLAALTSDVEKLVLNINSLLRERLAESSAHLKATISFIGSVRSTKKPLYLILCDCFSLPEYLFTLYEFSDHISIENALCSINPSGKTATFKYLAQAYLHIKLPPKKDAILRDVDNALRKKLGASSRHRIFRDLDNFVHYRKFENMDGLICGLFNIVSKLSIEIRNRLDMDYRVLLFADHGYDVVKNTNTWKLTHRWDKKKICVSPFVPMLLIGE